MSKAHPKKKEKWKEIRHHLSLFFFPKRASEFCKEVIFSHLQRLMKKIDSVRRDLVSLGSGPRKAS